MPIINTSLASAIQDKRPDCQPSSSTVNANGTDPGSTLVLTAKIS